MKKKSCYKIELDKYYTSKEQAKYVADKTREIIGTENITEYLEPSAGSGVFLDYLDKQYLAYDIAPESDKIIKQDYLKLELGYKKGRCAIGNPPFGRTSNLAVRFYKKLIKECDYIAFILPLSCLNNTVRMYEFDLIYSENLGEQLYSGRPVNCCLNIYKRPTNNILNRRPCFKLKEVDIILTQGHSQCKELILKDDYDLRILSWGSGRSNLSDNRILARDSKPYLHESFIYIKDAKVRDRIIEVLYKANWQVEAPQTLAGTSITVWRIYKYLKERIPELTLRTEDRDRRLF